MFKNIVRSFLGVMVCTTAAVAFSACGAGTDQAENGGEQTSARAQDTNELGTAAQPLSESFRKSCKNISPDETTDPNNIHVRCQCRLEDSSVFVNAGFDGSCNSDLANCDGVLKCGSC